MEELHKTKTYSTNKIIFPILFIVFSILLEIANFLYFGFKTSTGARMFLPTYFLIDFAVMCMIGALIFVVHNKIAIQVVFHLFILVQVVMYIVNTTMYGLFGDVLSFDLMKLGTEATAAFSFDLIDWGGIFLNVGIYSIIIASCVLLLKYNKKTYTIKNFSTPIIAIALFIFIQSFGICLIEIQTANLKLASAQETEIEGSDKYLWENFHFKIDAYKKFGFFGFYIKGTANILFPTIVENDEEGEYVSYIDEGYVEGNNTAPLYGDNLIVVLCESLDAFAIDPILTPTLWKLLQGQDSIVMENFYARNRTNNSEGIVLIGSTPKNTSIKDAYKNGYEFDYSLPKLFEISGDKNVTTSYVHGNTLTFYDRDITHKDDGIGFDNLYGLEDYTGKQKFEKWGQWITDVEFTANQMDKILPSEGRFLTFLTSLSGHGPWLEEKTNFTHYYQEFDANLEAHEEWFKENTNFVWPEDEDLFNMYRNYKTGAMDFDRTIKQLLEEIEERGLKDNTSILLYADHNAYYHDLTYRMKDVEKSEFHKVEVNKIPLILYSPALLKEQGYTENEEGFIQGYSIDAYCNTHDLLPTICDLYGMPYNTNLYHGYSIFSEEIEHSFFASHLGGMFTNKIFSQNITDIIIVGENVTEEEINRFREDANRYYEKQAFLEILYKNGINGTIL